MLENLKFEIISGFREKQFIKFANENNKNWNELKKLYFEEIMKKIGKKIKENLKKENAFTKMKILKKIVESIFKTVN